MKNNKYIGLAIFTLFTLNKTYCYSQGLTPNSINSAGIKMTQSNCSLSFTVGELVVLNQVDVLGNSIGNGFTSGAIISTTTISETAKNILDLKIYPNPSTDLVNIQIIQSNLKQLMISITDENGKEVYFGKYSGISNTIGINTSTYQSGIYVLKIMDLENQILGIYKINKQ